jgi:integrase
VEALVNHYSEHELPDIFHKDDPAAQVSDDEQRKTYSTQHTYDGYLRKWILPRWRSYKLSEVKAVEVEPTKRNGWHTFRHTFNTILNANGENPKVIQELLRHANLKVTMDTYVQAVSDEKRKAQSKVVEMLLPGIRKREAV